ncbi:unnamed protein product [marine sediment metagenome]|uniref:Uncharacterized protein n=1 Tax=marine sediment metagenome TaxID=412755 RepID=X0UP02_9ZZZZ
MAEEWHRTVTGWGIAARYSGTVTSYCTLVQSVQYLKKEAGEAN